MRKLSIGLLGCGTVGRGLVELLARNRRLIAERSGVEIDVTKILVRDVGRDRGVDPALLTDRPEDVIENGCEAVVELIGGVEPARSYVARAIAGGRHVVTANKALLSQSGGDLLRAAADRGVRLAFEASVCGAVPVIRAIAGGLAGSRIVSICGVVNGTCNYVLTRMSEDGLGFDAALADAQARGFAEADPTLDVDGHDAAQKLGILAELAFGARPEPGSVAVEGIRGIDEEDQRSAAQLGYALKHVAIGRDAPDGPDLRVSPVLLPMSHPLAHVRGEDNGVLLEGDSVGEMMFQGRGAGALPTASAVLSDVIEIARGAREPLSVPRVSRSPARADVESEFYLRFPVLDVPGVIGLIATALGNRGISIAHAAATLARARPGRGHVRILVHGCRESVLRRSVGEIARLPVLDGRPVVLRILERTDRDLRL